MYRGYLKHIVVRKRRENTRERAGEHCLTGARRAIEDNVMTAGGCDLKRALRALLPFHIMEVKGGRRGRDTPVAHLARERFLALEVTEEFSERLGCVDSETFGEQCFAHIPRRYKHSFDATALRGEHLREHAAHTAQGPIKCQLADE